MSHVRQRGGNDRQRGFGLVETMIGILIGLLVVLVIYNLFSAAERYKRMTVGTSDAQVTGLFSQFILAHDASQGGNGYSISAADLVGCQLTEAGVPDWTLRPIPVLITDQGSPDGQSESFITIMSAAPRVVWPVDFTADAAPGADFVVQSPTGFSSPPPNVTPYRVIVMANDGSGRCTMTRITNATAPDAQGRVTLTHDPVTLTYTRAAPARLLNLGPMGLSTRVQYDISNAQLRSTDLFAAAPVPNPLAQNIVLMKAQYGIDTNNDQIIDCWTPATTPALSGDPCGNGFDYSDTNLRNPLLPNAQQVLNSILAVRIAVVVRSDEPDLKDASLVAGVRPPVVLFNCAANDATCQSRIVLPQAACPAPYYNPPTICDSIRYRTYESVVPLRNVLYAATLP